MPEASYSFDALSLSSTERERVLTELAERLLGKG